MDDLAAQIKPKAVVRAVIQQHPIPVRGPAVRSLAVGSCRQRHSVFVDSLAAVTLRRLSVDET
jgi:hypothetical protein